MNIDFQRRVDCIAGIFICRILSLFSIMRKDTPAHTKPRKIMVILLSEMGSLVLARPMFDHIKKKYPNASIYVLLFEQNKEVLEILKVLPHENIFTVSNSSIKQLLGDSIHVLKKMIKIGIDTVLDCELFSRVGSISLLC